MNRIDRPADTRDASRVNCTGAVIFPVIRPAHIFTLVKILDGENNEPNQHVIHPGTAPQTLSDPIIR
ncbi:hypothetical protein [Burkholderia diffusa]|uniref:hypothetical protein n=1 Tax=Burkholderia diffusa TaxID=488732 RepID=UPI00157B22BE|nr:hypothetical protein [Burkholderia diffusa]NTY39854.1 hypothetical protein [Burkholderia diffusa]